MVYETFKMRATVIERDFLVISNIVLLNLLRHFKHLEFKLRPCDVSRWPDSRPLGPQMF